jgi:RNA recognition motif-containing protein
MKLLIRNLSRTTTEKELRALFEAFGAVQSCNLILDKESGKSKGFAFVEMPRRGDSKAAIKLLNGKEIDGQKIRVKYAEIRPKAESSDQGGSEPHSNE